MGYSNTVSQYERTSCIYLNRAPGHAWDQNRPTGLTEAVFTEPRIWAGGSRFVGLSFILSGLNGSPENLAETLRRLLALAEKTETPTLIALDTQNWWDARPDLWNWFDKRAPGFSYSNAENVEWTGPEPRDAVSICWRNWGRQIRVLPAPNLAAPRFRKASQEALRPLLKILYAAVKRRPDLFPGVKVGWETSVGINAFHYPNGNRLRLRPESEDPTQGLDMAKDLYGGLVPLGWAARAAMGRPGSGPPTHADHEAIANDYLRFLVALAREAGFTQRQIFTHSGGQFAPWEKHVSHKVACVPGATPGWSLYNTAPADAGDLPKAATGEWCAAEWLTFAQTTEGWQDALHKVLSFRTCRFVNIYNYEGIVNSTAAQSGLKAALSAPDLRK